MSNSNKPRPLKLKKLPKGIFKWKVTFHLEEGHRLSYWGRYCQEINTLSADVREYLAHNVTGRYSLHKVKSTQWETKGYVKYDYVLFENQLDVTMFKLVHGHKIRRIYRIETE